MLIVAGSLHVVPDERDAYVSISASLAIRARQAAGCFDFVQAADPIEPGRINLYERWASEGVMEAFYAADDSPPLLPRVLRCDVKVHHVEEVPGAAMTCTAPSATGMEARKYKNGRRVRSATILMREDLARRLDLFAAGRGVDATAVHEAVLEAWLASQGG